MQFQPPASGNTLFQGFAADGSCTTPAVNANGPTGVSQIVAKPDGTKFFLLGTGGIQSVDPGFSSFQALNGITGTPTAMAISPDGRYLYVGASGLFIVDTGSNSILNNTVPLSGSVVGIAFSGDSNFAYVLTNAPLAGSYVNKVSTSTRALASTANSSGQLLLPYSGATSIAMSPGQLLYTVSGSYISEIDPVALALTSNSLITLSGQYTGPLRFSPDGTVAYAAAQNTALTGRALMQLTIATHAVNELNYFNSGNFPPVFADVFPASASRVYAITTSAQQQYPNTLYDITPSPLSATPDTAFTSFPGGITGVTFAGTLSNEQPLARYLFLLINGTYLDRIDLTTNTLTSQVPAPLGSAGSLQFVAVPPQSGPASFVQFNTNQTVAAGATTAPLSAVILNGANVPVYNVPVSYAANAASGIVISNASLATNGNGFVTAVATMPATPGTYPIALTAGGATAIFNITVTGSGNGGGGGGGGGGTGSNQISILSGNGQIINSNQLLTAPLVVQLTNPNGTPMTGATVNFALASGAGFVTPASATTDQNGRASATFTAPFTGNSPGTFVLSDVNASSTVGSVDFLLTTYQVDPSNPGSIPSFSLVTPSPGGTISAGEGDVISSGVVATIFTYQSFSNPSVPIPNVGIRLANSSSPTDPTQPVAASCQGSSLSDSTGTARCNVAIGCQMGMGTFPVSVMIGEQQYYNILIQIGPGTSQTIKGVSGSNQSGQAGQTLAQPLVAQVTDNCGNPISGVSVTWAVTQGSATLSNTVTVSDSGGHVSTKVVMGQTPGSIQIVVSLAASTTSAQAVFTATNSVSASKLALVSGGNQTAVINQAFAQPLVFALTDTNNKPVQGIQVSFAVSSGSATLSSSSATTNSSGQAQVSVTAGATAGTVVIAASYASLSATASLTVTPPAPTITANSFTNAASNKPGLVACGLSNGIGSGIAPTISGVVLGNPLGFGPLPYTIATTSIMVNGVKAPLYSLSNVNNVQQVTFQTPCETPTGSVTVAVTVNGVTTTVSGVQVLAGQPGILTYAGPNGRAYGAVISGVDGSYVTSSNPVRRGQTYYLVATGLGQTTPPAVTNAAGTGQSIPTSALVIGVNNSGVPVLSAQYVSIGIYYVGFQIPASASTASTDVPLALVQVVGGQNVYDGQGAFLPGGIQ
jgi:uncharacterized protein (TIGR03437 family)